MRNVPLATVVMSIFTSLLLTTMATVTSTQERPRLVLDARLAPTQDAASVARLVTRFCREHGWHVRTRDRAVDGTRATVVIFRSLRDARHHDLVIGHSGDVRADFSTAGGGAVQHARITRLLDRLDPLLEAVQITDSTGYFDARNPTLLQAHFVAFHTLRRALIADSFRRGEDIMIDGRLYSEIPEPARDAFESAVVLVRGGRFDEAKSALRVAIGLYPNYARALILRVQIRLENGEMEDAMHDANRAIEIKPKMAACYVVRARIAVAKKHYARALDDLDRALEVEPGDVESRLLRGLVHVQGGRIPLALRDLETAAKPLLDRPFEANARYPGGIERRKAITTLGALADCYRAIDRHEDAERVNTLLVKLQPRVDRDRVVLDQKSNLVLERPNGWRLEDAPGDPRILVRMREKATENACRIAIMKQWGRVSDPDFKETFDRSVLQGLAQLGNSPRILKGFRQRTGGFDVYQILVENRDRHYCWIACIHHGGKMLTVYLTSKQGPVKSRAALQKVLEGISAPRETP